MNIKVTGYPEAEGFSVNSMKMSQKTLILFLVGSFGKLISFLLLVLSIS